MHGTRPTAQYRGGVLWRVVPYPCHGLRVTKHWIVRENARIAHQSRVVRELTHRHVNPLWTARSTCVDAVGSSRRRADRDLGALLAGILPAVPFRFPLPAPRTPLPAVCRRARGGRPQAGVQRGGD